MSYIDNFLNKITMYRLVLYGLSLLAVIAILFGFFGILSYGGMSLIYSLVIILAVCYITNLVFAKIFRVQTNVESFWITGFILFFITFPVQVVSDIQMLVIVAFLSMASKYLLVIKKKHIFNPAAVALFIVGVFGSGVGAWWIGSSVMLIPVLIVGFLVVRKVRRFTLFFSFLTTAVLGIFIFGFMNHLAFLGILSQIFTSWPIFFFGSIMLTEPQTTPPTRKLQIIYGAIVGAFFGAQFNIGPIYATPELALILGNIYSYIVSPRVRLTLTLISKRKQTADIYDFVWKPDQRLDFKPGQYLEWTLAHAHPDSRGNRRYFTVASSPTEGNIYLGTKFYPKPSTWKQKLISLEPGAEIIASSLAGDFTLPSDSEKKLIFIAGGIGITPFRSMAKYLIDRGEKRDIVLFFSNKTFADVAYKDIFDTAEREVGWKNFYIVNDPLGAPQFANVRAGFITPELLMKEVPDYKDRTFYISGSREMVVRFETALKNLGVPKSHIRTDFFPGFV